MRQDYFLQEIGMKTIKAVYEGGVFRPIEQVDLPETYEVEFEPRILSGQSSESSIERGVRLFQDDEVSLGKAAQIAGVDRWTFKDILKEKGIAIEIETAPVEGLEQAVSEIQHVRNP
jgi:predicted HTH domain antitoxin